MGWGLRLSHPQLFETRFRESCQELYLLCKSLSNDNHKTKQTKFISVRVVFIFKGERGESINDNYVVVIFFLYKIDIYYNLKKRIIYFIPKKRDDRYQRNLLEFYH